jgi:hypothetical protein
VPAGRRRSILAALALALAVVVVAIAGTRLLAEEDDPVADAIAVLADEEAFDSSEEAVVHFADTYQHLVDAAATFPKDCEVDRGRGRCLALNQAASWSLNVSTASGQCTQPAIQEGRLALLRYVSAASELGDRHEEAPPLPPLPAC